MILTPGCATDQVSAPAEITSMEPEPKDLVAAFQQMHGEMLARVQEGTLPADVGAKANELKIALEKYLIKTQAQLADSATGVFCMVLKTNGRLP